MNGQSPTAWGRALPVFFATYLIATFFWRLLVPAHELPMRSDQLMTVFLDACMVAGLIGLRARVRQEGGIGGASAPFRRVLFGCGLAAGVGLFAIRLTSQDAWWSGHLRFQL